MDTQVVGGSPLAQQAWAAGGGGQRWCRAVVSQDLIPGREEKAGFGQARSLHGPQPRLTLPATALPGCSWPHNPSPNTDCQWTSLVLGVL